MIDRSHSFASWTVACLLTASGCASSGGQAPQAAAGMIGRVDSDPSGRDTGADTARHGYTAADVRFMQHMIAHHGQALAMAALVHARTARDDIRLLAERIDASQKTEIAMMQRWLRERGETVPDGGAVATHSMAGHDMTGMSMASASPVGNGPTTMSGTVMPGMLTASQMDALTKASGSAFDQLFLQGMIQHHEGALTMVAELFTSRGAGQEPEIFRFASDVDADQRAEIARMRALLGPPAAVTPGPR